MSRVIVVLVSTSVAVGDDEEAFDGATPSWIDPAREVAREVSCEVRCELSWPSVSIWTR